MKKRPEFLALLSLAVFFAILRPCSMSAQEHSVEAAKKATSTLIVHYTGLRNKEGKILTGMARKAEGFPRDVDQHFSWLKADARDGVLSVQIEGLPYGPCALTCLDDENCNGDIDMFLGIPKEGWGFSKNPSCGLSAPDFEDCKFEIDQPVQEIEIKLNYVRKGK
ncbi:MAG: hypothetical protein CSA96_08370 [Bacteroidetes bacterium]|nr:MAG: hypothetical protein CSA96_08370 [Bacteroidota bacterium]